MKNSSDTIGNQTRGLSVCSATAFPHISVYLIKLSLTQMVVAMANVHYFTAGGKSNSDTLLFCFFLSVVNMLFASRHCRCCRHSASDIKHEGQPEHSSFLTFVFNRTFLNEGKRNRTFPMNDLHIFLTINGLTNLYKIDNPLRNLLTEDNAV